MIMGKKKVQGFTLIEITVTKCFYSSKRQLTLMS